jgi:hypothetical protein
VDRRGRTGEVVDLVDFDIERKSHIVPDQFEALVPDQIFDIAPRACKKIIDAQDFMTSREQGLAKKRADEPGPTGNKNAPTKMHQTFPNWAQAQIASREQRQ